MRHIRKLGSLVLADESTGAVDVKTGSDLLNLLRRLNRELGLTIVIVTHDRMLAKKVSRVVAIRDGKTSSELVLRQNLRQQLDAVGGFEEMQEEFAVPDQAGRVQIPREVLQRLALKGNRVRIEVEDGKILLIPPEN